MRVGILVEHGFLDHHVGVRQYLFTLFAYLRAGGHDVQFVSIYRPYAHSANWYRVHLRDPHVMRDNGIRSEWVIKAPAGEVVATYAAGEPAGPVAGGPFIWYTQLGTRLESAGFDVMVISNPWLVDFAERLPVPRQVGVAFDIIPNLYCFTQGDPKPFEFAARHARGYRYYRENCERTLAITEAVADDLVSLFGFARERVGFLPPLVPPGCLGPGQSGVARRPGAVVLASPLDPRKGLRAMPGLIGPGRGGGGAVSEVLMYGAPRCFEPELRAFFAALPPEMPVEWYPRATAATTERLFREAELLLFPSENEGLGLPLLEAQLRGCRAVARPKRPMSDLLAPGSRTLPGSPEADAAVVRELLADAAFDPAAFEASARAFFGADTLPERVAAAVVGG